MVSGEIWAADRPRPAGMFGKMSIAARTPIKGDHFHGH
jgi:hypothetical protein